MTRLTGHYNGKVIVPDEALDLPQGQRLTIQIQALPKATTLTDWIELAEKLNFSKEDLHEMSQAIEESCDRRKRKGHVV